MRKLIFLSLFVFISCKSTYNRLNIDTISEIEKQRVYDFGKRQLETCKTRNFIQLSKKETTKNLSELSLQEMQQMCDVLDKRNGKFIDMKLIEVIDETYINSSKIYRYKGNFERNDFVNEIRIWINLDGKFSGIIIREWKDEYIPRT